MYKYYCRMSCIGVMKKRVRGTMKWVWLKEEWSNTRAFYCLRTIVLALRNKKLVFYGYCMLQHYHEVYKRVFV